MIFYNPFFPQYPRIPPPESTKITPIVNNNTSNNPTQNIFSAFKKIETDTLIILGLLFILYTQESKDFSLMLCLLLLLFE